MDAEHLSYPVRKKTEKILHMKKKLDNGKRNVIIPTTLTGVFTCYLVFFCQRYFNYALATFNPWSKISTKFIFIDLGIFFLLVCSCFFMYTSFINYNKLKLSYESLRKDLIKTIDTEFCNCSQPQKCKDEYIEAMEEYGIDLVF